MPALERLISMEAGWNPDGPISALRGDSSYNALERRMIEATGDKGGGTVFATLADSALHPEGIAYDPASKRWFVGSVHDRGVQRLDGAGLAER